MIMKKYATFLKALLVCLVSSTSFSAELIPELKKLEPFVGKTYRAEFANSTPEKPVIDVSRWETHLNGKAVRIEHSINDGAYGGETIIFWDSAAKKIRYFYFTTEGFFTEAEVTFEGNTFVSREIVKGNTGGVSEVKAKAWLNEDGTLRVESQYLKEGKWIDGHRATYVPTPDAKVIFK